MKGLPGGSPALPTPGRPAPRPQSAGLANPSSHPQPSPAHAAAAALGREPHASTARPGRKHHSQGCSGRTPAAGPSGRSPPPEARRSPCGLFRGSAVAPRPRAPPTGCEPAASPRPDSAAAGSAPTPGADAPPLEAQARPPGVPRWAPEIRRVRGRRPGWTARGAARWGEAALARPSPGAHRLPGTRASPVLCGGPRPGRGGGTQTSATCSGANQGRSWLAPAPSPPSQPHRQGPRPGTPAGATPRQGSSDAILIHSGTACVLAYLQN